MKNFFSLSWRCIGVLLSIAFLSSANPVDPSYFPVLSEIQVTDSIHWNVEVDCSWWPSLINPPCSTDTFHLFCWQNNYAPPADSMRRPVIHEVFDSKGIAVLTPQHFPGLKLVKGSYVFLQIRYSGGTTYIWSTQIPTWLTSQQSVIGYLYQTCCEFGPTGCIDVCTQLGYEMSTRPTIGLPNSYAAVSTPNNVPFTAASVRLLSPKIHGQIPMAVSGNFTGQGTVDIFSANGSLVRSLPFASRGPGTYTVRWDGCNGQSCPVPAGTYVCRVKLGEDVSCKGFVAW